MDPRYDIILSYVTEPGAVTLYHVAEALRTLDAHRDLFVTYRSAPVRSGDRDGRGLLTTIFGASLRDVCAGVDTMLEQVGVPQAALATPRVWEVLAPVLARHGALLVRDDTYVSRGGVQCYRRNPA